MNNIENSISERKRILIEKGIKPRRSVSAECFGKFNVKQIYIPIIVTKTPEQMERISNNILSSIIFNNLDYIY